MQSNRAVISIWFKEDGTPSLPAAYAVVEKYLRAEFGEKADQAKSMVRLWAVLEIRGDETVCIGVLGTRHAIDVPLAHFEDDHARKLLVGRAFTVLSETLNPGASVQVYVDPLESEKWEKFLEAAGATPAHRYLFPVGPSLEVFDVLRGR